MEQGVATLALPLALVLVLVLPQMRNLCRYRCLLIKEAQEEEDSTKASTSTSTRASGRARVATPCSIGTTSDHIDSCAILLHGDPNNYSLCCPSHLCRLPWHRCLSRLIRKPCSCF